MNLRAAAGVSEACMNVLYDALRQLDAERLKELWLAADPYEPMGALLRHQIAYTVEKKLKGAW